MARIGASRHAMLAIAAIGAFLCLTGIVASLVYVGLDERSTPIVTTVTSTLGLGLMTLVNALRTNDAAKAAKSAAENAQVTASRTDKLTQVVNEHGVMCPRLDCPLKEMDWEDR